MNVIDTPAICLKVRPFREADGIVWFYSAQYGQIRAVARGIKKPQSKLAGATLALTLNRIFLIEGRELYTLRNYDRINAFPRLHGDIERLAAASTFTDVIHCLGQENDTDSFNIFLQLAWALEQLEHGGTHWVETALRFHIQLLDSAGYLPDFRHCIVCMDPLELDQHAYFGFSMELGGPLCGNCHPHASQAQLSNMSTKTIRLFLEPDNPEYYTQTLKIHRFLAYYWGQRLEKTLKSFDVLYQLLGDMQQTLQPQQ